jgi:tungstate transport system permease protein
MNTFSDSALTALNLVTSFDPALWVVVTRSLAVSATACLLAYGVGVALGAWLAVSRFAGRGAVLVGLNTLLALPSVVVGLVVYLLLSRTGPLGFLGWMFSFKAMVLAQFILVVPVVAALTRQVVEDVERQHGEQWASLGAGPWLRSLLLAWDARRLHPRDDHRDCIRDQQGRLAAGAGSGHGLAGGGVAAQRLGGGVAALG